jgi:hypothetical protein
MWKWFSHNSVVWLELSWTVLPMVTLGHKLQRRLKHPKWLYSSIWGLDRNDEKLGSAGIRECYITLSMGSQGLSSSTDLSMCSLFMLFPVGSLDFQHGNSGLPRAQKWMLPSPLNTTETSLLSYLLNTSPSASADSVGHNMNIRECESLEGIFTE